MNVLYALVAVAVLLLLVLLGAGGMGLEFLFGVIVPYAAVGVFLLGFIYRILGWARSALGSSCSRRCSS